MILATDNGINFIKFSLRNQWKIVDFRIPVG